MHIRLSFVFLILCVGCGREGAFEDIDTSTPIVSDIPNGKPMEYPKLYVDNDLPEYAGAIVTGSGSQVESLKDGVTVTAVSNDSIDLIMPFYVEAMEKLGYTYDSSKYDRSQLVADTPMSMLVFTKEKLRLSVTLTKLEQQQTEIKTNFSED
ncbi:MAG: hypothetical protein CMM01_20935 [Rhodopirellula sp.]|nr:hypothetical protein [Rhodopirellula sp.]